MAVAAIKMILNTTPTNAKTRYALNGTGTYVDMFTADNSLGQAAVADVRSGTVYASGNLTGTCAVPAAGSVSLGVPVGSGTGTAVLTPADVQSALTAQGLTTARAGNLDNLDATVSSRLAPSGTLATVTNLTNAPASVTPSDIWSHANRTITGGTVDTLTNAPTVPSVVQIRQEMDSNSTKLANLDATVSSRLASSAYTAAPTTAQIATAVEGSLLNEADGSAVLNAIVGAIGNQNLSEVSLVAAVRADLERNGGKLDSIPTSSAPSASTVAGAVRTELATELGRLDASVSSRLSPSGTLATVTNLTNAPASVTPTDIWSHATRTLTSASGPTAVEIRQEIDANSTKLDVAVGTRLAGSSYTAPANSDVAAIKAKTDALNTERLANAATTAIVGNLIAQANS
jgi:hypothetical protein